MYLPNTYEFFWNTSALKFREKMWKSYKNFWTKARVKKANETVTSDDVIELAKELIKFIEENKESQDKDTDTDDLEMVDMGQPSIGNNSGQDKNDDKSQEVEMPSSSKSEESEEKSDEEKSAGSESSDEESEEIN